jgi:hypothetical protein
MDLNYLAQNVKNASEFQLLQHFLPLYIFFQHYLFPFFAFSKLFYIHDPASTEKCGARMKQETCRV